MLEPFENTDASDGRIGGSRNHYIVRARPTWTFNVDGDLFRLVAETYHIHLAHPFDPVLAVHTSLIEPLPHQITSVYNNMLARSTAPG